MEYTMIVVARDFRHGAGADAIITCNPEQKRKFLDKILFDDDGEPTGSLKGSSTEKDGSEVEYYDGLNGEGDFVIVSRKVDDLTDLLEHPLSGWIE